MLPFQLWSPARLVLLSAVWLVLVLAASYLVLRSRAQSSGWQAFDPQGQLFVEGTTWDPLHILIAALIAFLPPLTMFVVWWLSMSRGPHS